MKHAHFLSLWFFVLNLIFSIHLSAAPWPKLDTDFQKLTYGMQLREELKSFFTGTANYGMEWWNITSDQKQIHDKMKGLYPASMDEKPLLSIQLANHSTIDVASPAQFEKLNLALIHFMSSRPPGQKSAELVNELVQKAKALQEIKPGELLSVLLAVAPIEGAEFKTLMKASNSEKISYLKSHLSEDLSKTTLTKTSKGKYTPEQLGTGSQAVAQLEKLFAYENDVQFLTQLIVLGGKITEHNSITDLLTHLKKSSFEFFISVQTASAISAIVKNNLEQNQSANETLVSLIVGFFQKTVQKAAAVDSVKIKTQIPYLKILEKRALLHGSEHQYRHLYH